MTNYIPLRYYAGGEEQFTVADPRVDELVAGSASTTPALLHTRALLAQAADRSVMIWVGGSSTAEGGASSGTKRFGDRLLSQLQRAYPNGGTETAVTYGANTPDASVGIHEVNRGSSGALAQNSTAPGASVVAANADIAVYMWGSNDIHLNDTPASTYEGYLRAMVADTEADSAKPVIQILGNHQPRLAWTVGSAKRTLWEDYTQAMYAVAADFPGTVLVVNASATFEALWANGDTSVWDAGDNIHLANKGNAVLADCYARALLS